MKQLLHHLLLLSVCLGLFHSANARGVEVINAGKNGHNSRQLLERFDRDALAHQPDLIILGGGTNDALNSRNAVEIPDYLANVESMILKARKAGLPVLLITGLPCIDQYVLKRHPAAFFQGRTPTEKMQTYTQHLAELGARHEVTVIDLFQLYQKEGTIGEAPESWLQNHPNSGREDGVHPTATGYQMIAKAIAQHLAPRAQIPMRIVCIGDSITFGAGARTAGNDQSYPAQLGRMLSEIDGAKGEFSPPPVAAP